VLTEFQVAPESVVRNTLAPVPTYNVDGDTGSMASPDAEFPAAGSGVVAVQLSPPSVLRNTPSWSVPAYSAAGDRGCSTRAVTLTVRPLMI
jgi:hypothetical protein